MCAAASSITPSSPETPVAIIHLTRYGGRLDTEMELLLSVAVEGAGARSGWFPVADENAVRGRLIDAFLDLWQDHRDTGLVLYLSDSTVRRLVREQIASFPGLVIRDIVAGGRMQSTWESCRACHHAEELTREPVTEEKKRSELLMVATDASRPKRGKITGLAAVGSDGRVRMSNMTSESVLAGEFAAVGMALKTWAESADTVWILTDSQKVSHFLNARTGSGGRKGMSAQDDCLRKILELERQGIEVRISWVRGHNGHLLNDFADRAAVIARRCAEFKLDNRSDFAQRLRRELQQALSDVPVEELRTRHLDAGESAMVEVR